MWQQVYNPLHSDVLSTIAAAVPVVTLPVLIATGAVQTHSAALIAWAAAILVAGAASGLSLIANTAAVAYGALGTAIAGLASVTGVDPYLLGAMVGRQLPFFSLIVPAWLIWAFAGWRGMVQVWPAILVTGVS